MIEKVTQLVEQVITKTVEQEFALVPIEIYRNLVQLVGLTSINGRTDMGMDNKNAQALSYFYLKDVDSVDTR